jgi:hypothetical protein
VIHGRARTLTVAAAVGALIAATAAGSAALADGDGGGGGDNSAFQERLTGLEEDPLVFSTTGNGQIRLRVDEKARTITYRLTYAGTESAVTQAHIHFGGRHQSGGISVFLCSNLGNGPAGTQPCPAAPGTVQGTIRPVDVIGPVGQGIAAGEFDELVDAIHAGVTYANVHTDIRTGGEIRAQINDHHHG